ncbi:uncharacterized protein LOC126742308 [Anthonomus grandis grandis]|uniref:uncharacterized protein LOC126742308 n=1 Tax=Anthonomus grandis grandis TaxID=2921223 RepID=UPI002165C6E2|nr:uncharacterized protein LOC126742308 [Anthonomus grandis grandis]
MPEYTFELERTPYYNSRRDLLRSILAPKLSDAKRNLGDTLAKVVFDQCEDALREDFGLKTPLHGPGNVLWVSPSDLLIGKVALKPPFTPKCLQALTHKGILEIGEGLEKKFKEDMESDKQKALDKYKAELLATIEDRMKSEIKDVEIRERLACHIEMEKKQEEFGVTLKEELNKLEIRIREQYEQILADQNHQLSTKWEEKVQKEVEKTVDMMTKQYQEKLAEQEERLSYAFTLEIKKEQVLRDHEAKLSKRKMHDTLRQLKHHLECTNLVNMMYILATERQKCCDQKQLIEDYYKAEIKKLENRLKEKNLAIQGLKEEKQKQIKEVNIREICLLEVIKQFQKFINFAFKSAPTQAEFLLSVEKMMVFELAKEVSTTPVPKVKESAIVPWLHDGTSAQSVSSAEVSSLDIKDNHDCLNELNPPLKLQLDESDALPAIYFKKKTYIREDFRDMLDVGVPMTPSNDLWNKDVEILMDKWADMVKDDKKPAERRSRMASDDTHVDLYEADKTDSVSEYIIPERRKSNKSVVQFVNKEVKSEEPENPSRRLSVDSKRTSRRSSIKPTAYFFVPPEGTPVQEIMVDKGLKPVSSMLLAAKDSLELLKENKRKSAVITTPSIDNSYVNSSIHSKEVVHPLDELPVLKSSIKSESYQKELVVETKDSLLMRMTKMVKTQSSREFLTTPKDSIELKKQSFQSNELKKRGSKLITAKNSIELLKESLHKLSVPSSLCQKRDKEESGDHMKRAQSTSFAGTCCEKCKHLKELEQIDALSSRSSDQAHNGLMTEADEKSVKISCIQVINLDQAATSQSVVSFNAEPIYLREEKLPSVCSSNTARASGKTTGRSKGVRGKRPQVVKQKSLYHCEVVGDKDAMQGDESSYEFTTNRIHSLIKLMSDQPDLMRLFTAGCR